MINGKDANASILLFTTKDDNEYENVDGLLDNLSMFTVRTGPVGHNPNCDDLAAMAT